MYPSNTNHALQASGDGGGDIEAQLACKEREWKDLQALRVQQLESSHRHAQEHFQQLREDFRFNLTVLERYDAIAACAQVTETARQEEMSQLHIQIAKLQEEREARVEEDQRRYQQGAAEHRLQMERLQRYTKESRGFDKRDAEDAMDGASLDGRELHVRMARYGRPPDSHYGRRGGGGGPPGRYGGYGCRSSRSPRRRRRSHSRSRSRSRTQ